MEKVTILWVQDNINGPINGLAKYEDEEVWFSRDDNSTSFKLFRLSKDIKQKLIENHDKYCELTGKPLKHGDPIKIRRHKEVKKIPTKNHIKQGESSVEAKIRTLGESSSYIHTINPLDITGDLIKIINQSDFTNYFVVNKIEVI
jgi:hypothetical protein